MSTEISSTPSSNANSLKDIAKIMFFDQGVFDRVERQAVQMSESKCLPEHFKGDAGACQAVLIQALQWDMSPFAIAQKTYNMRGKICYEAQLVAAVVIAAGGIVEKAFRYDYIGEWDAYLAKPAKARTERDEIGLGIICSATLQGEAEPREVRLLMSQCPVRNSSNWVNDPQQQLSYRSVQTWARRFAPGAILGVYSADEMATDEKPVKFQQHTNDIQATAETVDPFVTLKDLMFRKGITLDQVNNKLSRKLSEPVDYAEQIPLDFVPMVTAWLDSLEDVK